MRLPVANLYTPPVIEALHASPALVDMAMKADVGRLAGGVMPGSTPLLVQKRQPA